MILILSWKNKYMRIAKTIFINNSKEGMDFAIENNQENENIYKLKSI